MAKHILSETYPCFVTWTKTIEADTLDEARNILDEGGGISDPPIIGDILDGHEIEFDARLVDGSVIENAVVNTSCYVL